MFWRIRILLGIVVLPLLLAGCTQFQMQGPSGDTLQLLNGSNLVGNVTSSTLTVELGVATVDLAVGDFKAMRRHAPIDLVGPAMFTITLDDGSQVSGELTSDVRFNMKSGTDPHGRTRRHQGAGTRPLISTAPARRWLSSRQVTSRRQPAPMFATPRQRGDGVAPAAKSSRAISPSASTSGPTVIHWS